MKAIKMQFTQVCIIFITLIKIVLSVPTKNYYASLISECPQIKNYTTFQSQAIFKQCTDFSKISRVQKLDFASMNEVLCLIYYNSLKSYCQAKKDIKEKELLPKVEELGTNVICPEILKHDNIVKTQQECALLCEPYGAQKPNDICIFTYYFINLTSSLNSTLKVETKNNSATNLNATTLSSVVSTINQTKLDTSNKDIRFEENDAIPNPVNTLLKNEDAPVNKPEAVTKPEQHTEMKSEDNTPDKPEPQNKQNTEIDGNLKPSKDEENSAKVVDNENTKNKKDKIENPAAEDDNKNNEIPIEETEGKPEVVPQQEPVDDRVDEYTDQEEEKPNQEEYIPPVKVERKKPITLEDEPINSISDNMDGDSYFFSYFMVMCLLVVAGYVAYHNRIKLFALLLEGKKNKRQYRGRRPNSANYHKLDSNLEEAITSPCSKDTSHIIY